MAKAAAARKTADVLVIQNPDVQLVESDSGAIRSFLMGLVPFFTRAKELEHHAKQLCDAAKLLDPPTNGKEDAEVQGLIKTASAAQKTVEQHWGICQVVSSLHRKLTAKRAVA